MASSINQTLSVDSGELTIIPGTTPQLVITIDDDIIESTSTCRIDVVQNSKVILQIADTDISIDTSKKQVSHTFTQQETYSMSAGTIQIQIHGLTSTGSAWKSSILEISVGSSLTTTMI